VFRGTVTIAEAERKDTGDRSDAVLSCAVDDEVVVTYVDTYHLGGAVAHEIRATVKVAGEIDQAPSTKQYYVSDPELRAQKNLVESQAFLELGKIFKGLGLMDGVKKKCLEGIVLADDIIREKTAIKPLYKEEAFKSKWELCLTMGDLEGALATCEFFSRYFPDSGFADQALLRIGDVYVESLDYKTAIKVYSGVLNLAKSMAKAEAQFKVGEATEKMTYDELKKKPLPKGQGKVVMTAELAAMIAAMPAYRRCAELYPDSRFAGDSLAKVLDVYMLTEDYAQADDLLEKVFQEYPDSKFLDQMLLKWVLVAFKRGDFVKAREKCQQLLFEYPESKNAETARKTLPQILKAMNVEPEGKSADSEGGAK